jgi:hypothetical protein
VRPGCETVTHYFSCLVVTGTNSSKSASGHVTVDYQIWQDWKNRMFLFPTPDSRILAVSEHEHEHEQDWLILSVLKQGKELKGIKGLR